MYFNAISFYRLGVRCKELNIPLLPRICEMAAYLLCNCSIPVRARIGDGTFCGHRGVGVVIHPEAVIGKNCILRAHVVIGGKGGGIEGAPRIGDNVEMGAGAKILGPVSIGNNASIGANAVVLSDVPENAIAIGVPAKIIKNTQDKQ